MGDANDMIIGEIRGTLNEIRETTRTLVEKVNALEIAQAAHAAEQRGERRVASFVWGSIGASVISGVLFFAKSVLAKHP